MNIKHKIFTFLIALQMILILVTAVFTTSAIFTFDDSTPPITICTIDPPEPNGCNGWYVTDVNVTLNATDDISGVKEIHYRLSDSEWKVHYGDFLVFILDHDCLIDGSIEFYSVDFAGNQEETKIVEGIDIDQEPPYLDTFIEISDGNPKDGWLITINARNITDNCSGVVCRVRFLLNGVEQDVVVGPGPIYVWQFLYKGGLKITIGVECCDIAGNCITIEIDLKLSRNNIKQLIHPIFTHLIERFPLLKILLYRWGF
jgi:hypothetical protein